MTAQRNFVFVIILALAITIVQTQEPTILSFIIEHQQQQKEQILELTIVIQAFDKSLQTALAVAKEKAQNLKNYEQQLCDVMVKNKAECKHSAIINTPKITPKYSQKKKEMIYEGVKVHYELTIRIINPKNFGKLVDKILTLEGFVITTIQWKPHQEQEDQKFLQQGLKKGKLMCKQLGLTFQRFISVEQLMEEPPKKQPEPEPEEGQQEEQEEEPQQQEQPQQQGPEVDKYRLTLQCVKKAAKK